MGGVGSKMVRYFFRPSMGLKSVHERIEVLEAYYHDDLRVAYMAGLGSAALQATEQFTGQHVKIDDRDFKQWLSGFIFRA